MKFFHVIFLSLSLGLSGCAEETPFTETEQPPKIYPVLSTPIQGESLKFSLSSHLEIKQELAKFSEDDYEVQNLEDLSKLQALRYSYTDSLIGSGSIFATSPSYERDYIIRENSANSYVTIELPAEPYLSYYCYDVELDKSHSEKCNPHKADVATKLSSHNTTYNRLFELSRELVSNQAHNIQSVYFVSFELPTEILEQPSSLSSSKTMYPRPKVELEENVHSYNEQSSWYYDFSQKPLISRAIFKIVGKVHGVALINKTSGEVLAYNSIQSATMTAN